MMPEVVVSDRLETVGSAEVNADNAKLIIQPLTYDLPTVDGVIPAAFDNANATNPRVITDDEGNKTFDFAFSLNSVNAFTVTVGVAEKDAGGNITGIGDTTKQRSVKIEPRDTDNGFIQTEGRFVVAGLRIDDVGEYVFSVTASNPDGESTAVLATAASNLFEVLKK